MTEFRKVTMLPLYKIYLSSFINYSKAVSLYFTLKEFFHLHMAPELVAFMWKMTCHGKLHKDTASNDKIS